MLVSCLNSQEKQQKKHNRKIKGHRNPHGQEACLIQDFLKKNTNKIKCKESVSVQKRRESIWLAPRAFMPVAVMMCDICFGHRRRKRKEPGFALARHFPECVLWNPNPLEYLGWVGVRQDLGK